MLLTAVLVLGLTGYPTCSTPSDTVPAIDVDAAVLPSAAAASSDEGDSRSTPREQGSEEKKPETPPHTGIHALFFGLLEDVKALPSMPNLYLAAGGGAAALAVHPADAKINVDLRSHANFVEALWKPGHIVGESPVQMGAAVVTFAYGRLMDAPKASHFGMDMLRAQIIAEGLTEAIKYTVRRERPDGSDNLSFSSGHAAVTFATATVIERHLGWKMSVLGYSIAAYVATSRLHDNVHYVSDVVFGAAVGTISGRTVTQHGRNYWSFVPVRVPGGAALMVTRDMDARR